MEALGTGEFDSNTKRLSNEKDLLEAYGLPFSEEQGFEVEDEIEDDDNEEKDDKNSKVDDW